MVKLLTVHWKSSAEIQAAAFSTSLEPISTNQCFSETAELRLAWRFEQLYAPRSTIRAVVFTVEQRDALRERVLTLAEKDRRVVAGAAVGSLAVGGGDRFSDLDLTFAVADDVLLAEVLDDWTRTLSDEMAAVHLVDLERGPTIYRVFLLPDALQLDLSLTQAARFAPAGPRFRLLFGETAEGETIAPEPPAAGDLFGWGVIYGLHARACIERARFWH